MNEHQAREMKSTKEMRERARELATPPRDDFDRAVLYVLDDFDALSALPQPATTVGAEDAAKVADKVAEEYARAEEGTFRAGVHRAAVMIARRIRSKQIPYYGSEAQPVDAGKAIGEPVADDLREAKRQHLQEIADGAYGDNPYTRGRARDELAKFDAEAPPNAVESERVQALEEAPGEPLTADQIEAIILATEPAELSDRGDKIWTRRIAAALSRALAKAKP